MTTATDNLLKAAKVMLRTSGPDLREANPYALAALADAVAAVKSEQGPPERP